MYYLYNLYNKFGQYLGKIYALGRFGDDAASLGLVFVKVLARCLEWLPSWEPFVT